MSKNIMIVEDDQATAKNIESNLKSLGYLVSCICISGEEAIKKAEETAPDLILMDIQLKGKLQGTEAAVIIREQIDIPIIFLTVSIDKKTLHEILKSEPYGYIHKPVEKYYLHYSIELAFNKHSNDLKLKSNEESLKSHLNKLEKSERKFRTLFNEAIDMMHIVNAQGTIIDVNEKELKTMGYTRDEYIGKHLLDVIHPDKKEETKEVLKNILNGESIFNHVTIMVTKENKPIYIEVNAFPQYDELTVSAMAIKRNISERVQTEKVLRESEYSLLKAQQTAHIGSWSWNLINSEIVCSDEMLKIFGFDLKKEILSLEEIIDSIHPDDRDNVSKSLNNTIKNDVLYNTVFRIVLPDGTERNIHGTGEVERDIEGKATFFRGTGQDITERIIAEKFLYDSEQRLKEAQRIAKIGDFTWNVETGDVTWSESLFDILGYDSSVEIDYEQVNRDIHHPDDLERVTKWLNDAITSGETELAPNEYRIIRKDGEIIYVRTTGIIERLERKSVTVFATVQDISEQKKVEAALAESEQAHSVLLGNIPGIAYRCINDIDYTMEFISEGCMDITGYKPEDIIGNKLVSYGSLIHPEDKQYVWDVIQRKQKNDKKFQFEYRIITADGKEKWVWEQGIVSGISESGNKILEGIIVDVSPKKIAEKRLKDLLKEKEVLLQEIHHRVKNNLQVISSLLYLQSKYFESKNDTKLIMNCYDRVKAMSNVHEMLYQSKNFSSINIHSFVNELVRTLEFSYKNIAEDINFDIQIEENLIGIDIAIPLSLVINELVTNSLKHGFPNGGQGKIIIALSISEGKYQLEYSDNGIGIPEETVLESSETMGLTLIYELVKGFDGTIKLIKDKGTIYKITFKLK